MAGKKISELNEVTNPTDADEFVFVDKEGTGSDSGTGGKSAKITFANLKSAIGATNGQKGEPGEKGDKGDLGPQGSPGEGADSYWSTGSVADTIGYLGRVGIGTTEPAISTNGLHIQGPAHAMIQVEGLAGNSMIGFGPISDLTGSYAIKHDTLGDVNFLRIATVNAMNQGGGMTLTNNDLAVAGSISSSKSNDNDTLGESGIIVKSANPAITLLDTGSSTGVLLTAKSGGGFDIAHATEAEGKTSRFVISETGNVGIGTDSPHSDYSLHIKPSLNAILAEGDVTIARQGPTSQPDLVLRGIHENTSDFTSDYAKIACVNSSMTAGNPRPSCTFQIADKNKSTNTNEYGPTMYMRLGAVRNDDPNSRSTHDSLMQIQTSTPYIEGEKATRLRLTGEGKAYLGTLTKTATSSEFVSQLTLDDGDVGIGTGTNSIIDNLEVRADDPDHGVPGKFGITIRNLGPNPARLSLQNSEGNGYMDCNNERIRIINKSGSDENGRGIIIAKEGEVGIGTSIPQTNLDIVDATGKCSTRIWSIADAALGGTNMQGAWTEYGIKHGSGVDGEFYTPDDNPDYSFNIGVDAKATGSAGEIPKFKIGYSAQAWNAPADSDITIMTCQPNGNVGIGTANPGNKLHIAQGTLVGGSTNSNTSLTIEDAMNTGIQFLSEFQTQLRFGDADSDGAGSIIFEHTDNLLRLNTTGKISLEGGNVGIGTTNPGAKLDVAGGVNYNNRVIERIGGSTGGAGATAEYSIFTRGNDSCQGSGTIEVHAIWATPSISGMWVYKISGNLGLSLIYSNTDGWTQNVPNLFWDGNTLKIKQGSASVYYDVTVRLHNVHNYNWDPVWGDLPGISN
jgi:hypothetical protein